MEPITRYELTIAMEALEAQIKRMRIHKNESEDSFKFRQNNYRRVIAKLSVMYAGVPENLYEFTTTDINRGLKQ